MAVCIQNVFYKRLFCCPKFLLCCIIVMWLILFISHLYNLWQGGFAIFGSGRVWVFSFAIILFYRWFNDSFLICVLLLVLLCRPIVLYLSI